MATCVRAGAGGRDSAAKAEWLVGATEQWMAGIRFEGQNLGFLNWTILETRYVVPAIKEFLALWNHFVNPKFRLLFSC